MTKNLVSHVIWDFPVKLFNIAAKKVRQRAIDQRNRDARRLNG